MIDTHTPPLSTKMLFARIDPADSTMNTKPKPKTRIKFNLFVDRFEEKFTCTKVVCNRPAEFLGGFSRQTPSLSLTQNVTLYQFLGPYNIILPRHESFQIGQFILILALEWCTSKLSCRGKTIT